MRCSWCLVKQLQQAQQFLNQLAPQLPTHVQCVQLTNLQTRKVVASTCGHNASKELAAFILSFRASANGRWPHQQIRVEHLGKASDQSARSTAITVIPVYNSTGQRYV